MSCSSRCACVVGQDNNAIYGKKWHGRETEAKEGMRGFWGKHEGEDGLRTSGNSESIRNG